MCIRLGLVNSELRIDYHAVAVLMSLGNWYMYYQHPDLKEHYKDRIDIIHDYIERR